MIYLATLYREGARVKAYAAISPEGAVARHLRPKTDETIRVERATSAEVAHLAGLIAADHPQLWSDVDLCANLNAKVDAATETR